MRLLSPPLDSCSPLDLTVAVIASALLALSAASASAVLLFHLRTSRSRSRRRRRRLLALYSLWPARLLLVLSASLLAAAELLRLPQLHHRLGPLLAPLLAGRDPTLFLCRAYVLCAHALAEPAFLALLLFLLRGSTQPNTPPPSAPAAFWRGLLAALLSAAPFLTFHILAIAVPPVRLAQLGLPIDLLAAGYYFRRDRGRGGGGDPPRCTYPLFGVGLLATLGATYVPLFASACWGAVAVVINKRLRVRLYALAAAVVVALAAQVGTLAFAALWAPGPHAWASQVLQMAAFAAIATCAAAGEAILVLRPVIDALAVVEPPPPTAGDGSTCDARAKEGALERAAGPEEN